MMKKLDNFLISAAIISLLPIFTFFYKKVQTSKVIVTYHKNIDTITQLKSQLISSWLNERDENAVVLKKTNFIAHVCRDITDINSNTVLRNDKQIKEYLNISKDAYNYNSLFLLDKNLTLIQQSGNDIDLQGANIHDIKEVIKSNGILRSDLYRDFENNIHLDWYIALDCQNKQNHQTYLLVLRTHPVSYLYPILNQWPYEKSLGETFLVRKNKDKVEFGSNLKGVKNKAILFNLPINRDTVSAKIAREEINPTEDDNIGINYMGNQVIYSYTEIPDTNWYLITEIPTSEALAGINNTLRIIYLINIPLLIFLYFIVHNIINKQSKLNETLFQNKHIFNNTPTGILLINENGTILQINDWLRKKLGYQEIELIKKSINIIFTNTKDPKKYNEIITNSIRSENTTTVDLPVIMKNGDQFIGRVSTKYMENSKKLIVIIEDVTEANRHIDRINDAKEAAEQISLLKSNFLSNMSHEIRTPMNTIIGLTHLLKRTILDTHQKKLIDKIQMSNEHLLNLINDTLDFSKIESGKLILEHIEFEYEKILDNILTLTQQKADEKEIELIFDIDLNIPHILIGDPTRLKQILINYITNAIKFTEQGQVVLIGKVLSETPTEVELYFAVKDTGIGLSKEQINQLFNSFQQGDGSITRKYGGTGLGLAICKNLAELMGGSVGVDSTLNQGSTFWFTAKFRKPENKSIKKIKNPNISGKKILVVDDNTETLEVLYRMLVSLSFQPTCVTSGTKAIEIISQNLEQNNHFDVILVDWKMPEMDGLETISHIQKINFKHTPKLIIITGFGHTDIREKAISIGVTAVLTKPISSSSLFDTIINLYTENFADEDNYKEYTDQFLSQYYQLNNKNIILIEDNPLNQEITTNFLRMIGVHVTIANNGKEGLELINKKQFDIILMDIQMPVLDGVATTKIIRNSPEFNTTPIIAVTANLLEEDIKMYLSIGINDYVPKPVNPEKLWDKLNKWISVKKTISLSQENEQDLDDKSDTKIVGDEFKDILSQCYKMIDQGDFGLSQFIEQHKNTFQLLLRDKYDSFVKNVENFDFEKANEIIRNKLN
ncbi:PAS domain-containing hybrid sensor histidine kinase/response regulator [Ferrovum sp. JA12]|uniref:PAS domain-containing hybrid sensor histidine kinase/response regulator n=1 Tax=Ferrovum sp. JA12 TaxID=1356299 RepID=UPI0009E6D5AB|nr:PAS domain-containing hybrid sensor histidine kinase/response regulator [Ferrovum sp. JA12]